MGHTSAEMNEADALVSERTARATEIREILKNNPIPVLSQDFELLLKLYTSQPLSDEELNTLQERIEDYEYEAKYPFGPDGIPKIR